MVAINKICSCGFKPARNYKAQNFSGNYNFKSPQNDTFTRSISFTGIGREIDSHIPEGCLVARRLETESIHAKREGATYISQAYEKGESAKRVFSDAIERLKYSNEASTYDEYEDKVNVYERRKDGKIVVRFNAKEYFGVTKGAQECYEFDEEGNLLRYSFGSETDMKNRPVSAILAFNYDEEGMPSEIMCDFEKKDGVSNIKKLYKIKQDKDKMLEYIDTASYMLDGDILGNLLEYVAYGFMDDGEDVIAKKLYILPGDNEDIDYEAAYENYIFNEENEPDSYDKRYFVDDKKEN